jgi:hypothetical protein
MATPVSEMSPDCKRSEHVCDICTMFSIDFITFDCKHSYCKECFSKIDKCHMCRALFGELYPRLLVQDLLMEQVLLSHSSLMYSITK